MNRVGLLTAEGVVDHVIETRGSIDQRVAMEMLRGALADAPPRGSSVPGAARRGTASPVPKPFPGPRPKAPASGVAEPGPALRTAAAELRDAGLLVRFGTSDGVDVLHEEVTQGGHSGYVAVWIADIESAGADGHLPVLYGAVEPGADATRDLGRRVAATLRQAGLTVDWNDDPQLAILVVLPWAPEQPDSPSSDGRPPAPRPMP
jgi:hypothetical protein